MGSRQQIWIGRYSFAWVWSGYVWIGGARRAPCTPKSIVGIQKQASFAGWFSLNILDGLGWTRFKSLLCYKRGATVGVYPRLDIHDWYYNALQLIRGANLNVCRIKAVIHSLLSSTWTFRFPIDEVWLVYAITHLLHYSSYTIHRTVLHVVFCNNHAKHFLYVLFSQILIT